MYFGGKNDKRESECVEKVKADREKQRNRQFQTKGRA